MSNIISAKETAQLLGITHSAVTDLLRRGRIKGEKLGREWMVSLRSVKAWKQQREAKRIRAQDVNEIS